MIKHYCGRGGNRIRLLILVSISFFFVPAIGSAQTGIVVTEGDCSPIIDGATNVTVNCSIGDTLRSLLSRHDRLLERLTTTTPVSFVVQELGQPSQSADLGNGLDIVSWDSINFRLFYILKGDKPVSIGVMAMSDVDVRVPLLKWTGLDHINSITIAEATCDPSQIVESDARYGYSIVGPCYFGRGGAYLDWELIVDGYSDCKLFEVFGESAEFKDLQMSPCASHARLKIVLAHLEAEVDQVDDFQPLAGSVADFYYWRF